MLEETAQIARIDASQTPPLAWVNTKAQYGCERCAAGRGCGSATLAQMFGGNAAQPAAPVQMGRHNDLHVGDTVLIGIQEASIIRGSLWVYALPLVGLFGFAFLFGQLATAATASAGFVELAYIVGALVGLSGALLLLRWREQQTTNQQAYQPIILKKLPSEAWLREAGCPSSEASRS